MESDRNTIVYPHRCHLLSSKTCDVCNNIGNHFLKVNGHSYRGLWICNNFDCKQQALLWLNLTTISINALFKEFGSSVYVQRTNGLKETGWVIQGDAYQDQENGPFWVSVKDKHRNSKCVTLENLRSWN